MAGTSEDIMSLFQALLGKEEEMAGIYGKIGKAVRNPEVKRIIESFGKDEERHTRNARKIIAILKA